MYTIAPEIAYQICNLHPNSEMRMREHHEFAFAQIILSKHTSALVTLGQDHHHNRPHQSPRRRLHVSPRHTLRMTFISSSPKEAGLLRMCPFHRANALPFLLHISSICSTTTTTTTARERGVCSLL